MRPPKEPNIVQNDGEGQVNNDGEGQVNNDGEGQVNNDGEGQVNHTNIATVVMLPLDSGESVTEIQANFVAVPALEMESHHDITPAQVEIVTTTWLIGYL